MYRVAAIAAPTCTPTNLGTTVDLKWTSVAGASKYDIYRPDGTTLAKSVTAPAAGAQVTAGLTAADFGYTVLGYTGPISYTVKTVDSTYGTSSTYSGTLRIVALVGLLVPSLACPT